MKLKSFTYNFPVEYYRLGLYQYSASYNFYNKKEVEKVALTLLYNIKKRKKKSVCVSLYRNDYINHQFSYNSVKNAIKILEDLNIIQVDKGYRKYIRKDKATNEWIWRESKLTTLTLKPYDTWKVENLPISWLDLAFILHCNNNSPETHIVCRKKIKIQQKKYKFEKLCHDEVLNSSLEKINKFLIKKGYPNLQYKRVFGVDYNTYGRFYNSFQTLSKKFRQKIYEEQQWKELDFKSCIINILYLIETNSFYQGDIYNDILLEAQLPLFLRPLLKQILIIALNTKNRNSAIRSIRQVLVKEGFYSKFCKVPFLHLKQYDKFYEYNVKKSQINFPENNDLFLFTPEYILSFFEKNPILNKYLFSNSSEFTQNIESKTILKILHKMISLKILPLSIHDCFIIPNNCDFDFVSFMNNALKEECFKYKKNFDTVFIYKKILNFKFLKFKNNFIFPPLLKKTKHLKKYLVIKNNIISFEKIKPDYG